MITALGDALAWVHGFADPMIWVVLVTFLAGALLERAAHRSTIEWVDDRLVRRAYLLAWLALAAYWLTQIHYFVFQARSIVEAPAVIAAAPVSVYVGVLVARGRARLLTLSRAIAVMWLVYMPFTSLALLRRPLIEVVTHHSEFVLRFLTRDFRVITGVATETGIRTGPPITMNGVELAANLSIGEKHYPYRSTFLFVQDGHPIMYTIRIACTGIGSMAVFAGLIAAVRAPLKRKLTAIATAAGIIYVLNIARNVFISYTFGHQRLHVAPDLIMGLFGLSDPYLVSYYVSDRIISQSLSVVILVAITWIVVRQVPEVLAIVEEGLAVLTGREYDLSTVIESRKAALDGDTEDADATDEDDA
ncbi:archaeosortase A [Halococcoides cellulosivorans]|uniref:Archaeosortase A n=1 Tax=Halococcoides cellulosivorans TaxID=1679096 RepID=A0A2R4X3B5_9EURY|nr:archaeosortase A [Halococcoides cellulosivorans]AWB28288.1 archaeosortase A [Halococcoides cellulosivorans]